MIDLPLLSQSFQLGMQLSPTLLPMVNVLSGRDYLPPMPRRHTTSDADKVKKKSSPRNTKAWSLEDERALLQGRLQRVPYKQIGARIGKTDLACRLHFHQMVMAKRTPEATPGRSIVFMSSEHPPEVHRLAPIQSTLAASAALSSICGSDRLTVDNNNHPGPSRQREPMHQRSYSSPQINHNGTSGWPRATSPYSSPQAASAENTPSMVDLSRLNNIYKQHAADFWSSIAEKYSGGPSLDPFELEQAFLQAQRVEEPSPEIPRITLSVPPDVGIASPETSPARNRPRSSSHVRSGSGASSIAEKCSVESLLNRGTT